MGNPGLFGGQFKPAHQRQDAAIEAVVVLVERANVLAIRRTHLADRGDAKSKQVGLGMRRVTLEIPMQPPLALRHCQFVLRLGKMVHADEDIAGIGQPAYGSLENLQLGIGGWQLGFADAPLRLEVAGQMRVVVDGQAIRRQLDDLIQCVIETDDVLLGQAVDQVDRHRLETEFARGVDDDTRFFK